MKSFICGLTFVCQEGTKSYEVGETYNGLKLHKIEDKSIEYPNSITIFYVGLDISGAIIFEAINAPIEVEYAEDK